MNRRILVGGFALFAAFVVLAADNVPTFKLGGSIQIDQTSYFNDPVFGPYYEDNLEIRRAKLTASGNISDRFSYSASISNTSTLGSDSIFLSYAFNDTTKITVGNISPIFGYEMSRGSKDATFLEDSMGAQFFAAGLNMGTSVTTNTENVTFGASLNLLPRATGVLSAGTATQQFSNMVFSSRATYAFPHKNMHIGFSALYENYTSEYLYYKNYSLGSNFCLRGLTFDSFLFQPSSTGSDLFKLSSMYQFSLESAWVLDRLSGASEIYYGVLNNNNTLLAPKADSFWAVTSETSYMLTGETKKYSRSSAKITAGVTPIHDYGAFEAVMRSSILNLNSVNVVNNNIDFDPSSTSYPSWSNTGSAVPNISDWFKAYSFSAGLIWHANANVSIRGTFVHVALPLANTQAAGNNGKFTSINGIGVRAQIVW